MYASTWNGKKKNSRFFPGTTSNPPTPNDDASDNTSKPISFFKRHTYFRNFLIATFVLSTIMTITTTIVIKQVVPGTVQSAIDSSTITFGQTNVTNAAQDASTFDLYSEITVTCDAPLAVVIQDVRLTHYHYQMKNKNRVKVVCTQAPGMARRRILDFSPAPPPTHQPQMMTPLTTLPNLLASSNDTLTLEISSLQHSFCRP